jgi:hypothetical protein
MLKGLAILVVKLRMDFESLSIMLSLILKGLKFMLKVQLLISMIKLRLVQAIEGGVET